MGMIVYIVKRTFRRIYMETFAYKCPVCGFVYMVPAYWMSYSAEPTTEFPHTRSGSDAICENMTLKLDESQNS